MPPRPNRKDFRRVRAEDDGKNAADNEIRVIAARGQRNYISYAIDLLQGTNEKAKHDKITITGMGAAMHNAVNIAEVVKRRVAGLHQITDISSQTVTDTYEAIEAGKDSMTVERKVSIITITLSVKPLDTANPGYQAPLPADQVTEQEDRPARTERTRHPKGEGKSDDDAVAQRAKPSGKKKAEGEGRARRTRGGRPSLVNEKDLNNQHLRSMAHLKSVISHPPIIVDRPHFDAWVAAKAPTPGTDATIAQVRRMFTDALVSKSVPFREVGSTVRGLALSGPAIDMDLMSQLPKKQSKLVRGAMASESFKHVHEFQIPGCELWVDRFVHPSYPQHPVEISYFQLVHERVAQNALVDKLVKLSAVETVRDAIVGMKRWLRTVEARLEGDTLTKDIPLRAPGVLLESLVAAAHDRLVRPTAFELFLAALKDLAANGSGAGRGHVTKSMHNGTTWDVLQQAATCTLPHNL
jgi:DNA-binding protein